MDFGSKSAVLEFACRPLLDFDGKVTG